MIYSKYFSVYDWLKSHSANWEVLRHSVTSFDVSRSITKKTIERLNMTFTANGKRQKWKFFRLSSALCTIESKYLYLLWMVRDTFLFLCEILKDYNKRIENQRWSLICRFLKKLLYRSEEERYKVSNFWNILLVNFSQS